MSKEALRSGQALVGCKESSTPPMILEVSIWPWGQESLISLLSPSQRKRILFRETDNLPKNFKLPLLCYNQILNPCTETIHRSCVHSLPGSVKQNYQTAVHKGGTPTVKSISDTEPLPPDTTNSQQVHHRIHCKSA